ncbi:unnamed protein product [Toxocara canis]|uniref:Secreted protein n=1 Tax=Toxocara canis TaxID=6265 RepID=A0A183UIM2_TOXCA|nr:unnamed protein product [Toxocara canis]
MYFASCQPGWQCLMGHVVLKEVVPMLVEAFAAIGVCALYGRRCADRCALVCFLLIDYVFRAMPDSIAAICAFTAQTAATAFTA